MQTGGTRGTFVWVTAPVRRARRQSHTAVPVLHVRSASLLPSRIDLVSGRTAHSRRQLECHEHGSWARFVKHVLHCR